MALLELDKCPKCKRKFTHAVDFCPHCDVDFTPEFVQAEQAKDLKRQQFVRNLKHKVIGLLQILLVSAGCYWGYLRYQSTMGVLNVPISNAAVYVDKRSPKTAPCKIILKPGKYTVKIVLGNAYWKNTLHINAKQVSTPVSSVSQLSKVYTVKSNRNISTKSKRNAKVVVKRQKTNTHTSKSVKPVASASAGQNVNTVSERERIDNIMNSMQPGSAPVHTHTTNTTADEAQRRREENLRRIQEAR